MNITILTLGSRGDVQPYVALGKGLLKRGHNVTICTGKTFKDFVEKHGLSYTEAYIDFMEILKTEEGQAIFNGGGNVFKILKYTKEVINPAFRKTFDNFLASTKQADLIIYHPKAMVAPDLSEYLKIPCVSMPPVPMTYPITEFPSLAVTGNKNFGKFFNKLSYYTVRLSESASIKDINDFRAKSLHLNKRKGGAYSYDVNGINTPIVYPISRKLFPEVSSWNGYVELPGFFFLDMEDAVLDKKINEFLEKGSMPITISFSSMPMKDPEAFKKMLVEALEKTNDRAVVLTGVSGLTFEGNKNILAIEKAPHRLIFKASKGIIHHGGVGTMAEALLSGRPQVIMPFNVDQPFWAHQLYSKGYALKPLDSKKLKVDDLISCFKQMAESEYILKAKKIGQMIAKENGIETCVDYLETLLRRKHA